MATQTLQKVLSVQALLHASMQLLPISCHAIYELVNLFQSKALNVSAIGHEENHHHRSLTVTVLRDLGFASSNRNSSAMYPKMGLVHSLIDNSSND
jgi:hypothetical protein